MTLTDRSEPRQRQRAGDSSRDGRGRRREAPAILHYGFRPFFLLAGVHGVVAVPLWLWSEASGIRGPFVAADWHVHEMIFGYIGAVIAGFVLTAVPNWTGRMPLSGTPLALLALSWLAGRLAIATVPSPVPALAIDLVFPLTLTGAVLREIIAGRNWRNAPLAALLTLFTAALALHHLEAAGMSTPGLSVRIALGTIALMIALIGGRVTPSFTRNWLVRRGETHLPASFGLPDRLALVAALAAMLAWIAVPDWSGILLIGAGALLLLRLSRWQGHRCLAEPIVLILHLGYGWLGLALMLLGLSTLSVALVPPAAALHALGAGAAGTMTLAIMTRASLGHTGREIRADGWTVALYAAITLSAALRVIAPWLGETGIGLLHVSGILWSVAFLLFVLRYGPILATRRK